MTAISQTRRSGTHPIPVLVASVAGLFAFGGSSPVVVAAMVLVGFSPFALIGVRIIQRERLREL